VHGDYYFLFSRGTMNLIVGVLHPPRWDRFIGTAVFACWLLEAATAFASGELSFVTTPAALLPAFRYGGRRGRRRLTAFGSTEQDQNNVQRDIEATDCGSIKSTAKLRWRRPRSIALPPLDEGEEDWDELPPLFYPADTKGAEILSDRAVSEFDAVASTPPTPIKSVTAKAITTVENTSVEAGSVEEKSTPEQVQGAIAAVDLTAEEAKPLEVENKDAKDDAKELEGFLDLDDRNTSDAVKVATPFFVSSSTEDPHDKSSAAVVEVASRKVKPKEEKETMLWPPSPPATKPPSSLLTQLGWDPNIVIAQSFAQTQERPILLFDGACNLCNDWVNFCLDYDPDGSFRFASLQSKVGQSILVRDGRSPDDRSNIILATPAETYANSDATLRVVSQLEGLPLLFRVAATLTRIFLPEWFRDVVYKVFAANRHAFGDTDGPVCRLDLDGEFIGRFLEDPELDFLDENLASESESEVFVERRR
jgi:predicted DCC family thiol-disulfide oxidoreductase YuxK